MVHPKAMKRKEGPPQSIQGRNHKRAKIFDARAIRTQTSDAALSNGELNVEKFVKAREFEIRALEDGIKRSKQGLSTRAHQELPKELRRRTASHNAKRVPKRLRERAKKEMAEDNTPTVTSRRRKVRGQQRLRLETAQRLQILSQKSKARRQDQKLRKITPDIQVLPTKSQESLVAEVHPTTKRRVKRSAILREAPIPPARFRKRQIHKTWLPTHLWHSKRAKMTSPKDPMWRFALPLTPSTKSYRNTHRACADRGALAWDMSYMATIGLTGVESSIIGLLKALGVGSTTSTVQPWGTSGRKWRQGSRVLETWIHERDAANVVIAPVCIIWDPLLCGTANTPDTRRKVLLRIHPSAFRQSWEQVVRLAKIQKPGLTVDDLRFELGSIEITGPDAAEALVATLRPVKTDANEYVIPSHGHTTWDKLANMSATSIPAGATIAMEIADPRLRHPHKTLKKPDSDHAMADIMEFTMKWPFDSAREGAAIFDRNARLKACRMLASRKSINRRKALAGPGKNPVPATSDSSIPIFIYVSKLGSGRFGTWTVMLPFKCVVPLWHSLVLYPLSSGGTTRFGGLIEKRQAAYESQAPWFPADYPGTKAGMEWELEESARRHTDWSRRPKGRRCEYDSIDLGSGNKGELGKGWSCDWKWLCARMGKLAESTCLYQSTINQSLAILRCNTPSTIAANLVTTVKITMITKGRPSACARVYRLPSKDKELRQHWLRAWVAETSAHSRRDRAPPPQLEHLTMPGDEDLIGFITTGNFSLVEGRGVGIASLILKSLVETQEVIQNSREERHICIVRDAGDSHGRLARWELI